ncbi:hypothetical protein CASFOL_001337 [Castilleja foliolosa]|uniref:Uncharacterized protein n=1 Tax=Castilleja foliolosa TaxID=1961234 RepID=A0ABD3EMU2_9LAMI
MVAVGAGRCRRRRGLSWLVHGGGLVAKRKRADSGLDIWCS